MIKHWLSNARYASLMQSLMPAMLAVVLSIGANGFCWWTAVLAIIGVLAAHLTSNLLDDYFDYKADMLKDREQVVRRGIKAYTAKYPYLTDGSASVNQLRLAIGIFALIAVVCGLAVAIHCGWQILIIAAMAGFIGFFYSAPPIKFCYWGMGEFVTGLIFGPLLMMGVNWAATGSLHWDMLYISIPIGMLVMNILYTHSMIDLEGDAASDKTTLARLMHYSWAKLLMSFILNFVPYAIIVIGVLLGFLDWKCLFVLIVLPRSIWLFWSLIKFQQGADFSAEMEHPRKWLGPMLPNWENVRKSGLDWFLIRWLTCRNIVSGFCLVIIVVKLIILIF
ncbi:MAG: prenyltransferase [Bacteroidales bacterium]|nr:prenyltransferase [Bacteroidales bacterium]